jgi:hypothetical protein
MAIAAKIRPSGSRSPPPGPMTSQSPPIASTDPPRTMSCGIRRVRTHAKSTSAMGARYSMRSVVDTGMRSSDA